MLSISTSWNDQLKLDYSAFLNEVKDIGFNALELGYTVTHEHLAQIEACLPKLKLRVNSLHNFCPIPNDEPSPRHASNHYRLSAIDEKERAKAIFWTKHCIDVAQRLDGKVVVIHAGTLELVDDPSIKLVGLFKEGKDQTSEFKAARERLIEIRGNEKAPFIKNLEGSLSEVVSYAGKKGIKIGLETRYYPTEIPNFEEIGYFLNLFDSKAMGYWHDVGHGDMQERLGLRKHSDFLTAYQSRLIGMHIHGMLGARDHMAPFTGDLDSNKFLPYLNNSILKVIEARYATKDQVKLALEKLR